MQLTSVQMLGLPFAVISSVAIAVTASTGKAPGSAAAMITVNVQSVSLDVDPEQLRILVQFGQCAATGPTLPVLPSYPPGTQPSSSRVEVQLQAHMLFGQLQTSCMTEAETYGGDADLAFWLASPSCSFTKSTIQVGGWTVPWSY